MSFYQLTLVLDFVLDSDIHQDERVHGHRDTCKVDDGQVDSTEAEAVKGLTVQVLVLQHHGRDGGDGLDDDVLKDSIFAVMQEHITDRIVVPAVQREH